VYELNPKLQFYAVAAMMAVQSALIGYSATRHSPTHLEPAFLASGIAHWEFGRHDLYCVNPPLVRMVAAIPVIAAGCRTNWPADNTHAAARSEYAMGARFLRQYGAASVPLMIYARWMCIPFSLIGTFYAYRWAHALYGPSAAMAAVFLCVFEPNLLAHGELITPDAACLSFGIMAGYYFWHWLRVPHWKGAVLAGVGLGLALASKFSWLLLVPIWPALWMFARFVPGRVSHPDQLSTAPVPGRQDRTGSKPAVYIEAAQLAAVFLVALYIVNGIYGFDGTLTRLKDFEFSSRAFTGHDAPGKLGNRFRDMAIGHLPVPVPSPLLVGLDTQKSDFEEFHRKSYLRGEWKLGGWWYYYLYGLLVKVPCGIWGLLILVVLTRATSRRAVPSIRDELVLLAPAIALLVVASSQTSFNMHLRYVFPSLGLMLVFLSQAFSPRVVTPACLAAVALPLMLWTMTSTIRAYPHHLAHFNEFVGGSRHGYKHLLGSSLDWGQDWLMLNEQEFDEANGQQSVFVSGYSEFCQFCRFHQVRNVKTYVEVCSVDDYLSGHPDEVDRIQDKRWLSPCIFVVRDNRAPRAVSTMSPFSSQGTE
jgi:hypothetical protein